MQFFIPLRALRLCESCMVFMDRCWINKYPQPASLHSTPAGLETHGHDHVTAIGITRFVNQGATVGITHLDFHVFGLDDIEYI